MLCLVLSIMVIMIVMFILKIKKLIILIIYNKGLMMLEQVELTIINYSEEALHQAHNEGTDGVGVQWNQGNTMLI